MTQTKKPVMVNTIVHGSAKSVITDDKNKAVNIYLAISKNHLPNVSIMGAKIGDFCEIPKLFHTFLLCQYVKERSLKERAS